MHVRDRSCAVFCEASDGATADRRIPNRIFGQFFTSLSKDNIANYAYIDLDVVFADC